MIHPLREAVHNAHNMVMLIIMWEKCCTLQERPLSSSLSSWRALPIISCGASHKLVKICRRWFWATLLKPPPPLSTSVQYFCVIWMVISPKKVQSQSCQNKRKNKHNRQFWGGGCHVRRIPAVSSFQLFFCGTWRTSTLWLVRILEVGGVRGK